jgi:GDP-4-dehydro-6-deoxy-D-mannose reductase
MGIAFVTGISGFVGNHLARFLRGSGWTVHGFDQRPFGDGGKIFVGDLADRVALKNAMVESKPDVIFHLAGMIKSDKPQALYQANMLGTVNLFDSLIEIGQRPVVIAASSSAVYGSGFGGRPISEKFKPRPMTHYAVSKLAQEIAALRYFDAFDLPVMIVRMFNLLGPGQSPDLACSAFARQIALAEIHDEDEIVTGDLSARRDFVDVRDAARAFALIAEKGKAGQIYNVCSGRAVLMRKCLDEMLSMSPRQFEVRMDAGKVQKNDVPIQVGDARKLNRISGWRPQIKLRQSLSDLLNDWRQRVKSELE